MIESKDKAKEILEYCITYLGGNPTKKLKKEMEREIEFMIDTD